MASLETQWLRIQLPVQETWVLSLVWENPTCHVAFQPMHHNYSARALEPSSCICWAHMLKLLKSAPPKACPLQQEKPQQIEALTLQLESSPHSPKPEKSLSSNEDPAPKNK